MATKSCVSKNKYETDFLKSPFNSFLPTVYTNSKWAPEQYYSILASSPEPHLDMAVLSKHTVQNG